MILPVDEVVLRPLEEQDLPALYAQKNDPEVAALLGGFSPGMSRKGLAGWLDYHRGRKDEVLWAIADAATDACLGHVGLYQLDHRVRSAEFAIMIGDKARWGGGLGKRVSRRVVDFGFDELNLNRIQLTVLATNTRARALYEHLGFTEEGVMREVQFKGGRYLDLVLMSLLRRERDGS